MIIMIKMIKRNPHAKKNGPLKHRNFVWVKLKICL